MVDRERERGRERECFVFIFLFLFSLAYQVSRTKLPGMESSDLFLVELEGQSFLFNQIRKMIGEYLPPRLIHMRIHPLSLVTLVYIHSSHLPESVSAEVDR